MCVCLCMRAYVCVVLDIGFILPFSRKMPPLGTLLSCSMVRMCVLECTPQIRSITMGSEARSRITVQLLSSFISKPPAKVTIYIMLSISNKMEHLVDLCHTKSEAFERLAS